MLGIVFLAFYPPVGLTNNLPHTAQSVRCRPCAGSLVPGTLFIIIVILIWLSHGASALAK